MMPGTGRPDAGPRPVGSRVGLPTRKEREFEAEALPCLEAIRAFSLRLTGSASDADDLVQDTYLRADRFWHRYTPGTNCRSWLFTICRNAFIRRWRRRTRQRELLERQAPVTSRRGVDRGPGCFPSATKDPEEASLGRIVSDDILEAVDRLPPAYRECLRLRLVDERAYREVAEMLDVPVGTVRSRIHRGRRILQESLREYRS